MGNKLSFNELRPSQTLSVWAYPKTAGRFTDSIVCCIRENPEPITFDVACHGVRPEIELDKKILQFEKVSADQVTSRYFSLVSARTSLNVRSPSSLDPAPPQGHEDAVPPQHHAAPGGLEDRRYGEPRRGLPGEPGVGNNQHERRVHAAAPLQGHQAAHREEDH